jgi:hypothetical protein
MILALIIIVSTDTILNAIILAVLVLKFQAKPLGVGNVEST